MDYKRLREYILSEMRMQHIYQPVMIKELLQSEEHRASTEKIARQFLINDEPQLQYYKYITKVMPGKVLQSHDIVKYEPTTDQYVLKVDSAKLGREEISDLIRLCESKILEYEARYGKKSIWHSRFAGARDVPGPLQFQVLKRARQRCELCGVSAKVKALQVDHIIPRSKGGLSVIENLQALCYSCNAQKQDKDSTDFRGWTKSYGDRDSSCIFCKQEADALRANSLAVAYLDRYPVTEGHTLVSPRRHTPSFFDLGSSEQKACMLLLDVIKHEIKHKDSTVSGFNIGINDGSDAGQTILHCHIHLIPRRKGDVDDPRGGIRHVIPGKERY